MHKFQTKVQRQENNKIRRKNDVDWQIYWKGLDFSKKARRCQRVAFKYLQNYYLDGHSL